MMKLLLAFVALCTLYVRAQNGEPGDPAGCESYLEISRQYETCTGDRIKRQGRNYSADSIYTNAKLLCKNRPEIMECMREALGNCSNNRELFTITDNGFNFCDVFEVDPVMATFFERNAGSTVMGACFRSVLDEVIETYGKPRLGDVDRTNGPPSLETFVSHYTRFYTWYISKFMLTDLDEALKNCDGMTRRTVFGIVVASANVESGWGLDLYEEFKNLVQGDVGMFNLPA